MSGLRRCLLLAAWVAGATVMLAAACLYFAAGWLKGGQSEDTADVIIVLAGSFDRALHAADLYARGVATRIMVSVPKTDRTQERIERLGIHYPRQETINREILLRQGVPADRIELVAANAISTADEAQAFAERLKQTRLRVLVVTSPYHVRRASLTFRHAFGANYPLAVTGTPYEDFPDEWWRSQDAARNVLLETSKTLYYLMGGRFRGEEAKP